MKTFKLIVISLSAAALIGCGGDADDSAVVVSEEAIQKDLAKIDEVEIPDIETVLNNAAGIKDGAAGAPPPGPGAPPPGPGAPGAPPAPAAGAGEIGVMIEEQSEGGTLVSSPLQLMQQAVQFYHSPTERGLDDQIEEILGKMNFETEQGMDRARAKLEAQMQIPPLQSLDGLVKARIIARIPPAPDGKQWAYDPATKIVSLKDL